MSKHLRRKTVWNSGAQSQKIRREKDMFPNKEKIKKH